MKRLIIDGILDLHTFRPAEVADLLPEYIRECRQKGINEIRIIHGKGKGILRKRVIQILEKHPHVLSYGPALDHSGWGATIVHLKAQKKPPHTHH